MKRFLGYILSFAMFFSFVLSGLHAPEPVDAASRRKCFTINDSNTTVFSDVGLTRKKGAIFGSDEVTVIEVHDRYSKVSYSTARGTKTGYIFTNAILTAVTGNSYTASAKVYTFKRPGGSSYGYIDPGDTVTVFGSVSSYTQVKYPVGGGYKYAFIKTEDAQNYITGSANNNDNNTSHTNTSNPTVFSQADSRWKNVPYGKGPGGRNATLSSAGCGILAYVNAVYYMTGNFIQPSELAAWSVNHGYRINGVGTSYDLYKAYADSCGIHFGFRYAGKANSVSSARLHLQNGGTAIIGVPNHIMALATYSNGKYLVLDSYKSSSRGTNAYGYRWMKASQFTGKMSVSNIILLSSR